MSQSNPPQLVNLHYSNVMDWLVLNGFIPSGTNSTGTTPQCVIDIDIQFAKLHFTENKVASVPPEIVCLIKGDINYMDATAVYAFLEKTEGKGCARNMFGLFKSEALKSWWNLLRSWEVGNLHLSHAINMLVKLLAHDVPYLQRKFQAAEKTVRTIDNR